MKAMTTPIIVNPSREEKLFDDWYGIRNRSGIICSLFLSADEAEKYMNDNELRESGCSLVVVTFQ